MANIRAILLSILAASGLHGAALAQVRVVVDGRVQEVPHGVVRTITRSGDRQTIHDAPFRGPVTPGAVTITTTEIIDEDDRGRTIHSSVVTRIQPVLAVAYTAPAQATVRQTLTAPYLKPDPDTLEAMDRTSSAPEPLRIARDPATGHFIATIRINGVEIRAIIDTGASTTILSPSDAWATGAAQEIVSTQRMVGIGGYTLLNIARVHSLDVAGNRLGGFSAAIGQEGLGYTLLGQSEIARLGRIVIEDGTMTITPRATRLASR